MGNSYGVYGYSRNNNATASITNSYGGYFTSIQSSGNIANSYGVYIGNVTGLNTYGLYQTTATAKNYFAGDVGIGTSIPTAKLDVMGKVKITDGSQ